MKPNPQPELFPVTTGEEIIDCTGPELLELLPVWESRSRYAFRMDKTGNGTYRVLVLDKPRRTAATLEAS